MTRFCDNGHPMEDSWDMCPYCQRTGYQRPKGLEALQNTRIEQATRGAAQATAGPGATLIRPRKRVLVGWLVALDGPQQGEDFRVREGQNIIGSGPDADIRLQYESIAARHASLGARDGGFSLTDLASGQGTFLNDRSDAIAREALADNDVIRVGAVSLKFKVL
jgi:pSer/pThr/pTyr-binding forkhead associated (FHA) protein